MIFARRRNKDITENKFYFLPRIYDSLMSVSGISESRVIDIRPGVNFFYFMTPTMMFFAPLHLLEQRWNFACKCCFASDKLFLMEKLTAARKRNETQQKPVSKKTLLKFLHSDELSKNGILAILLWDAYIFVINVT